jgi:hypothetical protein
MGRSNKAEVLLGPPGKADVRDRRVKERPFSSGADWLFLNQWETTMEQSDTPKMLSSTVIGSAKRKEKSDNLMSGAGIQSAYITS